MIPWCSLNSRSILAIHGPERIAFLQGLVTQNITDNGPLFSAILTPQGRFFSDFFALNTPQGLFLECAKNHQATVLEFLEPYSRLHDVSLRDCTTQYGVCAGLGQAAVRLLEQSPFYTKASGVMIYTDPRHPNMGIRAWVPYALWNDLPHLCLYPCQESDYHAHRMAVGIAEGVDLIPQQSIILEYGYNDIQAISWTKGCYMGQELMARTFHRGVVRKHLYRLQLISGHFPPSGTTLYRAHQGAESASADTPERGDSSTHRIGYMGSHEGLWGLASLHESVENGPTISPQEPIFLYLEGDFRMSFSVLLERAHSPRLQGDDISG